MATLPDLSNVQQLPGFHWTGPVAEHVNWHRFVDDRPPLHLDADDFDPWSDEVELTLYGQAK
jgi:hypothetical protein